VKLRVIQPTYIEGRLRRIGEIMELDVDQCPRWAVRDEPRPILAVKGAPDRRSMLEPRRRTSAPAEPLQVEEGYVEATT